MWEYRKIKGRKYRPFTQNQTNELEVCHNLYQAQLKTFSGGAPIQSYYVIRDNFEVSVHGIDSTIISSVHGLVLRSGL